jgi:glycosyltransferase involved in cell wall biosynthesis
MTGETAARTDADLSIVVPMYNEAPVLDRFFSEIEAVVADIDLDDTLSRLLEHRKRNPAIKVIDLSRNFGKEAALSAGLDHAAGAAVIPIDADLEEPPELIPEMIEKWRQGYDVVFATRSARRSDSLAKRATAALFYRIFNTISEVPIASNTGDYRLMSRPVVDAVCRLPERTRFMKGLFSWVGFRQTAVTYERGKRSAGTSKWSYWKLWNFALDGLTAFSTVPLRIWTYIGTTISALAFLYAVFLFFRALLWSVDVPGYTSLMVSVLFIGGIQLITLGVLGEYLGRVYQEVKGRPLYLARAVYGLGDAKEDEREP